LPRFYTTHQDIKERSLSNQFFTVLLHEKNRGGHYMVVAASDVANDAQVQAYHFVRRSIVDDDSPALEVLGTFRDILRPQTAHTSLYGSETLHILTPEARQLDEVHVSDTLQAWERIDNTSFVITVPGVCNGRSAGETWKLKLENDEWRLTSTSTEFADYFPMLQEAIVAAATEIERFKARCART
jgi:hypothetical protein